MQQRLKRGKHRTRNFRIHQKLGGTRTSLWRKGSPAATYSIARGQNCIVVVRIVVITVVDCGNYGSRTELLYSLIILRQPRTGI